MKLMVSLCSCCYFSDKSKTLEDAEVAMLELYCERSQLKDGHAVLDVGCGWGSLSLYIARKYSNCKVTGICNSTTQKAFIDQQCRYVTLTTHLPYDYVKERERERKTKRI
jgi:cyclopropane fatty-acyl-phospholipid synthase-like methyltransferase